MNHPLRSTVLIAAFVLLCIAPEAISATQPAEEFASTVKSLLGEGALGDWQEIEKVKAIAWAPLPPTMLEHCLPDGGCFSRVGVATFGGKKLTVIATGARSFVHFVYLRNAAAPIGEAPVLGALAAMGISAELARCPLSAASGGSTNWYHLKGAGAQPGILAIQSNCAGKVCEGFTLSQGTELPPLQPKQLSMYTEQCVAGATDRKPIASVPPHEQLARTMVALLPPASGLYDWASLKTRAPEIVWQGEPQKVDSSFRDDPNPFLQAGTASYGGREIRVTATGDSEQVKWIYLEEASMHPRGEDLLAVLRAQGLAVELARCGPEYTESFLNWYRVTSPKTRPATLEQALRYDGKLVQDSYKLRFDASLPKRDPRDLDPGVGRCKR